MNTLNLKKFEGFGTKTSRSISVTRAYSFGIPPTFLKENDLLKASYAVLYYDDSAEVIAIKFLNSDDGEPAAFKVHKAANAERGASIIARSFFRSYNIDPEKAKGKYNPSKETIDGVGEVFLLDLKSKISSSSKLKTVQE